LALDGSNLDWRLKPRLKTPKGLPRLRPREKLHFPFPTDFKK
jgi:hypothetical protein